PPPTAAGSKAANARPRHAGPGVLCRGLPLQGARHLDLLEYFDLVPDPNVVVALHADTALHAVTHFGDVVLEATQRLQLAFEDHHVVAQYANRPIAVNGTLDDHAAGNGTELRRAEHVAHFGGAQDVLADIAAKHAGQSLLDVFDDVVDHVVVTHVQAFGLDDLARTGIGPHVEAEQHRIGGQRQVGIRLGDTTDTATNHAHLHLIVAQAAERALQSLQR